GDEYRHAAGRLRQQLALRADEAHRVIFVFVNVGAKRRARHVGVDLIADRNDAVADDFERDRIDGRATHGGIFGRTRKNFWDSFKERKGCQATGIWLSRMAAGLLRASVRNGE